MAWERTGRDVLSGELRMVRDAVEVADWDGEPYRFRVSDGEVLAGPPPSPTSPPARPVPGRWMDRARAWLRG